MAMGWPTWKVAMDSLRNF